MRKLTKPRTTRRLLYAVLVVALASVALIAFALPASAQLRTFRVRLLDGSVVTVTVDAPAGVPMNQVAGLPGTPIQELTPPSTPVTPPSQAPSQPSSPPSGSNAPGQPSGSGSNPGPSQPQHPSSSPSSTHGQPQQHSGSRQQAQKGGAGGGSKAQPKPKGHSSSGGTPPMPSSTGPSGPAPAAGSFFNSLPGPGNTQSVPNFVINNFRVPFFMLPIYQAAGNEYGVRWEVLAAINEIETDYGRNLSISSAGAEGWMQFMPATWRQWGVDATDSGRRDPYNPPDAVFAAARYLKASGAQTDIRKAIFAYNNANWYVDSVMLRAQLLAAYPPPFISSLTGLTKGRFPVGATSRYGQGDIVKQAQQHAKLTQNATSVDSSQPAQHSTDIYTRQGAPAVATGDGIVEAIGKSPALGNYVVLQDAYGNRYRYSQLESLAKLYPLPKQDAAPPKGQVQTVTAATDRTDPRPTTAASAGVQGQGASNPTPPPPRGSAVSPRAATSAPQAQAPPVYKARLFANPNRPNAQAAGGLEQILQEQAGSTAGQAAFNSDYAGNALGLNASNSVLRPLKKGATVVAGTVLGRIGRTVQTANQAPHLHFEVQPAGKDAPMIDPKPLLDGWRLLAATDIYRPSSKDVRYNPHRPLTIGQDLLLTKSQIETRVLSDPRLRIYGCGRNDIKAGQIDPRVLDTLEYLAESGFYPTVSALKCGHSEYTTSGTVSQHSSGDAVDISAINGIPMQGHEQPGSITEKVVKKLMLLQGTMKPDQIISLLSFGANTLALPDHYNHVHIGFVPLFGENTKLGQQAKSILDPSQWGKFIAHLDTLSNPLVTAGPSKYALPDTSNGSGN